ncbi:hypothetical protein CKAH01_01044 [Colletotrichum kahawae]|uniref:Uncharacterized protein n=1 Tax=Colletotrichum kahawae TaxID=34407 RepID=A0AAD9YD01_COLKA|nr:hypothetical protein CKAH01_01044 [Colletotrichum kahawae]
MLTQGSDSRTLAAAEFSRTDVGSGLFSSDRGGPGKRRVFVVLNAPQSEGNLLSMTSPKTSGYQSRRLREHFHMLFFLAITRVDGLQCHIPTSLFSLMNRLNDAHEAIMRDGCYWSKCCVVASQPYRPVARQACLATLCLRLGSP